MVATALLECPNEPPQPQLAAEQAPACLEDGAGCSTEGQLQDLRQFAKAVDANLDAPLQRVREARQNFERRANDYRYAEMQGKADDIVHAYGPAGPMKPGGSYLYELHRWADSLHVLHRACQKSGGACSSMLGYLQEHPEDDITSGGAPGRTGSGVYEELRRACALGGSRSPVPNDTPVWCDEELGTCAAKSSRKWWREMHTNDKKAKPWFDDRPEYDHLKEACSWIRDQKVSDADINALQQQLSGEVEHIHQDFCSPKWVEGYCQPGSGSSQAAARHEECTLGSGQHCRHGLVVPESDLDETARWKEPFPEHPVRLQGAPLPAPWLPVLQVPPASTRRCRGRAGPPPPATAGPGDASQVAWRKFL